jgi:hypothetical protein
MSIAEGCKRLDDSVGGLRGCASLHLAEDVHEPGARRREAGTGQQCASDIKRPYYIFQPTVNKGDENLGSVDCFRDLHPDCIYPRENEKVRRARRNDRLPCSVRLQR